MNERMDELDRILDVIAAGGAFTGELDDPELASLVAAVRTMP